MSVHRLFVVSSVVLTVSSGVVLGCKESSSKKPKPTDDPGSLVSVLAGASASPSASATMRAPKLPTAGNQTVEIPAGTLVAGSLPGDEGRDPALEPKSAEMKLGSFSIDRFPYPNDPAKPPMLGVSREEARQHCKAAGKRLCTEVEWERACKGPDQEPYPSGGAWAPQCLTDAQSCASGFDVMRMGVGVVEWTEGELTEEGKGTTEVLRGGGSSSVDTEHRCARRVRSSDAVRGESGFRCCSGTVNGATLPVAQPLQPFRRVQLDAKQLDNLIRSAPRLAHLAPVELFDEVSSTKAVLDRGKGDKQGNTLTTSALLWSPALGEELLILAAHNDKDSVVAAFHKLPGDRYALASSLILQGERGPIVLGFNGWAQTRVAWSTCWGCEGEEGAIIYRAGSRVIVEQL